MKNKLEILPMNAVKCQLLSTQVERRGKRGL